MKKVTLLFLIISLSFVHSCAENDLLKGPSEPIEQQFRLSLKSLGIELFEFMNVNAYLFSEGKLVSIFAHLPLVESTATIHAPLDAQIYSMDCALFKDNVRYGRSRQVAC